jgi:FAD/FMN-containing dehydrogenase
VAIKASGHDYSGRSTARHSLLLWTAYLKNFTFAEHFPIDGVDQGPAVTVGPGVGLKTIYAAAKAQNKMFIGGTAATVSAAGGYTQGAGHSAFSPIYGLAADNVLRTWFYSNHRTSGHDSRKAPRIPYRYSRWLICDSQLGFSPRSCVL